MVNNPYSQGMHDWKGQSTKMYSSQEANVYVRTERARISVGGIQNVFGYFKDISYHEWSAKNVNKLTTHTHTHWPMISQPWNSRDQKLWKQKGVSSNHSSFPLGSTDLPPALAVPLSWRALSKWCSFSVPQWRDYEMGLHLNRHGWLALRAG